MVLENAPGGARDCGPLRGVSESSREFYEPSRHASSLPAVVQLFNHILAHLQKRPLAFAD